MRFLFLILCSVGSIPAVDSRVCARCHREIYRQYMGTPMARSSGVVDKLTPASFRTAGGAEYRIAGTSFSFQFEGEEIRRSLNYYVGAGATGRSYLTSVEGFLFEAPVSFYASTRAWDLSPGYVEGSAPNLVRAVEPACLNCHSSGLNAWRGTVNGYDQPPFSEGGVSCGRCHQDAEAHVAALESGKHRKPQRVRASACAQCHLPGVVTIGKSVFVWDGVPREATVNGHFEQLARSRCALSSAGKLWCGSCHNPHGREQRSQSAANYRESCMQCHNSSSCTAVNRTGDDCIACHMPKTNAMTVQHAVLTDHTIPRRPPAVRPIDVPRDAKLKLFGGGEPSARDLGLAYAAIALRDGDRMRGSRAIGLLENAPPDAKVLTQLAQLLEDAGDRQRACDLYARAVARDPQPVAAAVNLGICYAAKGELDRSIRLWRAALSRNPGLEVARLNLAVALYRTGNAEAARAALTEALRFNPVSSRARAMLRELGH
jgi:predicted CXXCH cytochrome family protein